MIESQIASGCWARAQEIIADLRLDEISVSDPGAEIALQKAAAVLLAAKIRREHLRTALKTINASRHFQSMQA